MIYLDYQATTPLAPEVAAAMRPWIEEKFANPHSPSRWGREAAAAIEVARGQIERALGLDGGRFAFTSGATEALNWALKGSFEDNQRRKLVTVATEHAAVLDSAEWLEGRGVEVVRLQVGSDGLVDLDMAEAVIDERTAMVATMLVNNEIGVVQPIGELAGLAHAQDALFFCDAVQGFGRVPLPLDACDMVAISAHKVHGPKGIGALWLRNGVVLDALLHGGGQEGGVRSGTLSPALCVGFGEAARLLGERRDADHEHVEALWRGARRLMADWALNGPETQRYHGNLNIRRDGVDSARLISEVRTVAFSAGSACASGSGRPSHVLAALGLSDREARSSLRFGFGRYTTEEELSAALALVREAADRQLSFAA